MTDYLAFLDCETTGLDERKHRPWEIACKVYSVGDGSLTFRAGYVTQVTLTEDEIAAAEPKALEIGGFHKRYRSKFAVPRREVAGTLNTYIPFSARLCGSNPDFDARFIGPLFDEAGMRRPWHYRYVDVPTLAAGKLTAKPVLSDDERRKLAASTLGSYALARLLGVDPEAHANHTALGDVEWTVALYAAVHGLAVS